MTTYTPITAGEIDTDSPVTVDLMTKMRDNPIAITEGAAGAPRIQLAAMDSNSVDTAQIVSAAVGTGQIATALTTAAGTISNNSRIDFALNNYALFPHVHFSGNNTFMTGHFTDAGSGASPRFGIQNDDNASRTYDIDHRYLIAS